MPVRAKKAKVVVAPVGDAPLLAPPPGGGLGDAAATAAATAAAATAAAVTAAAATAAAATAAAATAAAATAAAGAVVATTSALGLPVDKVAVATAAATAATNAAAVAADKLAAAMSEAAASKVTAAAAVAAAEAAQMAAAMAASLVVPAAGFIPPAGVLHAPAGMFSPAAPGGLGPTAESVLALRAKLASDRLALEQSQLELESLAVLAEQRRVASLREAYLLPKPAGSALGRTTSLVPAGSAANTAILVDDGGLPAGDKHTLKSLEVKAVRGKKRGKDGPVERLILALSQKSKSKQDDGDEDDLSEDESGMSESEEDEEGSVSSASLSRVPGHVSREDRKRVKLLFQPTEVNVGDLQELSTNLAEGDGGSVFTADQARAMHEAMVLRVGSVKLDVGNKGATARRLSQPLLPSSGSIPDLISQHVFGTAPDEVIRRVMKNPYQILPLSVFDPKHRDLFGGADPFAPKRKRKDLEEFNGTANSLISDFTRLILVTCTTDVQYGIALISLSAVALDLIKQDVDPAVVAGYIWSCRVKARHGLVRGSTLECFLELDHQMFLKAGGRVKANGEVMGGGVGLGPETLPVGNISKRAKVKVPNHLAALPPRAKATALAFVSTTCHAFNSEAGCHRRRCIFKHLCAACNQSHGLVDCSETGKPQPMLQILDNPNKRVGLGKGV